MRFPSSLQKTGPAWRNVFYTVGIIFVIFILIEVVLRVLVSARILPMPGIGSIHPELNVKIQLLEDFARKNDGVDCIFLGSSMFDDSVNPKIFSDEYKKLSGKEIHCFNLSISSLTAESASSLTSAINQLYHPKLLIFGISPRDLTTDFDSQTRPIVHEPWITYHSGKFSIQGWLKDNSVLYREYLSVVLSLNPNNRKTLLQKQTSLQQDGFEMIDRNLIGLGGQNVIKKWKTNPNDIQGLKRILRLGKSFEPQVILVETPIHDNFLEIYVEGSSEKYFSLFQHQISSLAREFGTALITSVPSSSFIPDEDWGDVKHLNYKGAERFSRWLANQLWHLEVTSQIHEPFQQR